jgi:hypothetical protein
MFSPHRYQQILVWSETMIPIITQPDRAGKENVLAEKIRGFSEKRTAEPL